MQNPEGSGCPEGYVTFWYILKLQFTGGGASCTYRMWKNFEEEIHACVHCDTVNHVHSATVNQRYHLFTVLWQLTSTFKKYEQVTVNKHTMTLTYFHLYVRHLYTKQKAVYADTAIEAI